MNLWKVFWHTSVTGKFVLLILLLMSIQSWYVIISSYLRYRAFYSLVKILREDLQKIESFKEVVRWIKGLEESLVEFRLKRLAARFVEVYEEYMGKPPEVEKISIEERINLASKELREHTQMEETELLSHLEKGLGFLATVGNVAPFIGLFGTVWGIMQAFHEIGLRGSASLATVAPGIAEALINTAMGLFCAIPAVIAYNYFLTKKQEIQRETDLLFNEVFLLLKRGFLKKI